MEEKEKKIGGATQLWMIGIVLLFFIALASLFFSQTRESNPMMEAAPDNHYEQTIVVAMDSDYQPYSFLDEAGAPAGYDVELIYLLANAMHKNVEIRMTQWKDAQAAVLSGEADVLMGLDYNMESLREFDLSMPLHNDPFVVFGKKQLSAIEDLYGQKIATLDGSGSFAAFLTPYQLEDATTTYASYSEAFQSVEKGENDFAVAMYSVGRRAIANLGDSQIKAVGPTLAGNYLCIGTRKGNTALAGELTSAIIQLKKSGGIDALGSKWLGRYVEVISARDFVEKNLAPLVFLLAITGLSVAFVYIVVSRRLAKSAAMQHEMTKRVLEYQQLLTEATKGLYESIYELDLTHNCAGGESTRQYFESLGVPGNMAYDEALKIISEKQIKAEFIPGYRAMFSTANALQAYKNGTDHLSYEFMIRNENGAYYWMRITARIFYWLEDASVRMITYRQNIDNEKKKEHDLEEKVREDALTGLYNKVTTSELIRAQLARQPDMSYAFLIIDIDDFKHVNDSLGHAFGDCVIIEFAKGIRDSAEGHTAGRIGGDEFAMFLPLESRALLEEKAGRIIRAMSKEISVDATSCSISASMGIALYPQDGTNFELLYRHADAALYRTKKNGKNGYTFYDGGTVLCCSGGC